MFVGTATVPSSACTPWSRSGSTHLPTDSSNTIECLRQLTLLNLWLLWSSPWITTFVLCTGLVHRIAFPHMCLYFTVNGVLSLKILLFKCFIFDRRIDSFPVWWAFILTCNECRCSSVVQGADSIESQRFWEQRRQAISSKPLGWLRTSVYQVTGHSFLE